MNCSMQHRILALLALPLALAACTRDNEPVAPAPSVDFSAARHGPPARLQRTLDEEFTQLVQDVPGFGGLFFDTDGKVNIYLTNPETGPVATPAVAAFLRRTRPGRVEPSFRIRRGDFDYRQLAATYQRLLATLRSNGITQRDIDESRNRIVIGVIDDATAQQLRANLSRLADLPPGLVEVQIIPPTSLTQRLYEAFSPRIGGLQIESGAGVCTLGFNVRMRDFSTGVQDPAHYFITNSHCTVGFGQVSGGSVGQPNLATPVGIEVIDPPLFNAASEPTCPLNRLCRFSDAALIRYNPGVRDSNGYIARVLMGNRLAGFRRIEITAGHTFMGEVLNKLGRTTWETSGRVTGTCITVTQFESGVDTGRDMLCQNQADYHSEGGDSGSPVFFPRSTSAVELRGIHWGTGFSVFGDPNSPVRATFSNIHRVQDEINAAYNAANGTNYGLAASYHYP